MRAQDVVGKAGEKFWDLLASSVLTSSVLALALTGTACYIWASGGEVREPLYALLYGVVAFFFMSKKARNGG